MNLVSIRQRDTLSLGIVKDGHLLLLEDLVREAGEKTDIVTSMERFLEGGDDALLFVFKLLAESSGDIKGIPLDPTLLAPPISRPGKIIAVGLNYKDHTAETEFEPPAYPLIFAKFPNSISGPTDPIILPMADMEVDSEAELAVVIGRKAKAISIDTAYDYIAGYMALNDVSARKWQFADKQWTRGKSCDTFCPTGPWITTREDIPDPHNLTIKGTLNSQVLQESNTSHMIFRIPELLAFISSTITLDPGDIIATGTPSGVGAFRKPPIYLKAGDMTGVEIEKLGKLSNPVRLRALS
jgi:2-keto-4-pentenoate hydratase/2-oxohepta-3-ene-1,7-dioic acid hydratase in catechol pathway